MYRLVGKAGILHNTMQVTGTKRLLHISILIADANGSTKSNCCKAHF